VETLVKAEVEGTLIDVCEKCTKFSTRVVTQQMYEPITKKIELKLKENDFISKYGEMIKRYRESKGLTREEFAKRISEKESVIKRVEEEQMKPNDELTKRIENFLNIKLMQETIEETKYREEKKKPKLTVGDIAEVR
jgi:uncharacterized protein (TIGR00270 family)